MRKHILIASSVHIWNDPRIFYKEAMSLSKFYTVSLLAVGDNAYFSKYDISITCLPVARTLRDRFKNQLKILYKSFQKFDVIHLHDPELLWVGCILTVFGKRVIYDMHEDVKKVLFQKEKFSTLNRLLGNSFRRLEKFASLYFSGFIIAETSYQDAFKFGRQPTLVRNYTILNREPIIDPFELPNKPFTLLYVGKLSRIRGTLDLINAVQKCNKNGITVFLILIGMTRKEKFKSKLIDWVEKVTWINWPGWLPMDEMEDWIKKSSVGIAPLHSIPNYDWSLPTKIFDYMNWGLPFIYSDLPINKNYFKSISSGISFSAGNEDDLYQKIIFLYNNKRKLQYMSECAVKDISQYSWEVEAIKLISLYKKTLN